MVNNHTKVKFVKLVIFDNNSTTIQIGKDSKKNFNPINVIVAPKNVAAPFPPPLNLKKIGNM